MNSRSLRLWKKKVDRQGLDVEELAGKKLESIRSWERGSISLGAEQATRIFAKDAAEPLAGFTRRYYAKFTIVEVWKRIRRTGEWRNEWIALFSY